MGSKREHDEISYSDNDGSGLQTANKRHRGQSASIKDKAKAKSKAFEAKTDSTYGQRCAFPGLDGSANRSDDELEWEDEGDALSYLQAVRQQASGIPHLIVAPKAGPQLPAHLASGSGETGGLDRDIYSNGVGDSRGYYQDGAYTAAPDPESAEDEDYYDDDDDDENADETDDGNNSRQHANGEQSVVAAAKAKALREAYFGAIASRFTALRARLHEKPPASAVASLPRGHETYVGHFGPHSTAFAFWAHRLRHTDPLPVQVAAMDRQAVLRLLRMLLRGKYLRRGYELRERTSRWVWALLARLPDRGEMDYVEVGWVRDLGKRAVLMMVSVAQMAALREHTGEDVDESEDEDEDVGVGEGGEEQEDEAWNGLEDDAAGIEDADSEAGDHGAGLDADENKKPGLETEDVSSQQQEREPEPQPHHGADDAPRNGKIGDDADGEMEMDLDDDIEDGEVSDEPTASPKNVEADIAAAKERLLARLAQDSGDDTQSDSREDEEPGSATQKEPEQSAPILSSRIDADDTEFDEERSRINMRATLNMILTVAGEFYGQRDLLEFRQPFLSL